MWSARGKESSTVTHMHGRSGHLTGEEEESTKEEAFPATSNASEHEGSSVPTTTARWEVEAHAHQSNEEARPQKVSLLVFSAS